jgi:hypothetical protein
MTAPLGSGTGAEGVDFENIDDSFPLSDISSQAFLDYGEPLD